MKHASSVLALFVLAAFAVDATNRDYSDSNGHLEKAYENRKVAKGEPAFPGLDAGLNRIATHENPLTLADTLGYRTRDGKIQIVAVTDAESSDELKVWLEDRNATYVSSAYNLVQAFVPIGLLSELENDSRVLFVRKPSYIQAAREPEWTGGQKALAGSYTSEGVAAMNADQWHSSGFRGQGVKIGIVAYGYYGYVGLIGVELPTAAKVHYRSFSGSQSSNSFGTANAEIVHDVAPDAELFLAEVSTEVDSANAIAWLKSSGADVIVSDLFLFPQSPGDGTGMFAQIASDLVSNGIIPVASAGMARMTHWQGRWSDSNSNGWQNFQGEYEINFMTDGQDLFMSPPGVSLVGAMVWNQWDRPTTDLDLCAVVDYNDGNGVQILQCAEDVQNGSAGQLPREISEFTTPAWGYYGFAIKRYSGSGSPDIEVFLYREDAIPQYRVSAGSLVEPADSQDVIAVGAVDSTSYSLEPYSSSGPTNGAGGSISGGRIKPDLAGYAKVTTYTYGTRALYGTGPAAMHVAGAAALVWSANPIWSNAQVRSFLESKAIDRGPSGKDNDYGYGRLYLGSPSVSCTYSISPTSQSFGSSGSSGSFNVTTQSGCTWTASTSSSWIHITGGSSGTGNGSVSYTVDANSSSSQRSGTIQAAGKTFNITQSGAASCTYSISPSSRSFDANGGTATVSVSTTTSCSWTAVSNTSWITITGGSSGTGSGTVSYRVSANSNTSSRSGTMIIAGKTFSVSQAGAGGPPPSGELNYFAVIARTTGALDSMWVSSTSICNLSSSGVEAILTYQYGNGISVEKVVLVPASGIVEWQDTASDLFGVTGNSSGVVEIETNVPLLVAVRTFNSSDIGTFGQSLPGATVDQSMTQGEIGTISPVKRTPEFRTNIGFINTGQQSCTVVTTFKDSLGSQIGSPVSVSLQPGQWKQKSDILKTAGVDYVPLAYAVITVSGSGAKVWAYATVIDNATGDPTGLPLTEVN